MKIAYLGDANIIVSGIARWAIGWEQNWRKCNQVNKCWVWL